MTHSAVMAAAFYVPAVIFHDPVETPAQKGTALFGVKRPGLSLM